MFTCTISVIIIIIIIDIDNNNDSTYDDNNYDNDNNFWCSYSLLVILKEDFKDFKVAHFDQF